MTRQTISLEEGKYELRFDEASGALCAFRYGEPWQDFTGSKFIYLLMQAALAQAADAALGKFVRKHITETQSGWLIKVFVQGAPSLETLDETVAAFR